MEEDTIFSMIVDAAQADEGFARVEQMLMDFNASLEEAAAAADDAGGAIDEAMAAIGAAADSAAPALDALATSMDAIAAASAGVADTAPAAAAGLDEVAAGADVAAASMDGMAASVELAGAGLGELNFGPLSALGLVAVVAGGAFMKMGADGEDALKRVQALTGASDQQMEQYSSSIDQMASKYGKSVADMSGGLYDIVSVGFQGADALNTLKVAAQAAAAGGVDLHTVTSGLVSIMKAFGVDGAHASDVMDTLLLGVRDGKASFQDYSNAIGLVAVTAKGAGFSLNESAAALSTLTAVFPNARRAGMDLQHLMTTIGVNSAAVGANAKKMGLHFNEAAFHSMNLQQRLQYLQQITHGNQAEMLKLTGGTAGFAAAQVLLANKGKDFAHNLDDMKNKTGSTQKAFDTWNKSIGAHAADMTGSLTALAHQFAVIAGPAIIGGLDALSHMFSGLDKWLSKIDFNSDGTRAIMIVLAGVIGGILVFALTAAAVAAWAFLAPILIAAAPFILIGLAIGVVVAAIYLLATHWKQIGAWLSTEWHAIVTGVGAAFSHLGDGAHALWDHVTHAFGDGVAHVKQAILGLGKFFIDVNVALWNDIVGGVKAGIARIGDFFSMIGSGVHAGWAAVQAGFHAGIAFVEGLVTGFVEHIVGGFKWLFDHNYYFHDLVVGIQREFTWVRDTAQRIWADVTGAITREWTMLKLLGMAAFVFIKTTVEREFNSVRDIATHIWTTITSFLSKQWENIKLAAMAAFVLIKTGAQREWALVERYIIQPVERVIANVQQKFGQVRDWLRGVWATISRDITSAWNGFVSSITGSGKRVTGSVQNGVMKPIQDTINGAISWMKSAGGKLIDMLVSGITSKIGAVKNAVSNVAKGIAGFLGFHSPTEEGPGAEADKWMPALGDMLARGLHEQVAKVKQEATAIAGAVANGIHSATGASGALSASVSGSGAGLSGLNAPTSLGALPAPALASSRLYGGGAGGLSGLGALGGANPAVLALLTQIATGVRERPLGSSPQPATLGSVTQQFGGMTFNGVQNIAQLYAQLSTLSGLALEDGLRGAQAGSAF